MVGRCRAQNLKGVEIDHRAASVARYHQPRMLRRDRRGDCRPETPRLRVIPSAPSPPQRQHPRRAAVEIDEAQAPPVRDHARRQRVVAHGAAAELRHQRADVGDRVALDPQQDQLGAGASAASNGMRARRKKLAGSLAVAKPSTKAISTRSRSGSCCSCSCRDRRQMRRLPLHGAADRLRVIVPGARAVAVMVMIVIVSLMHRCLPSKQPVYRSVSCGCRACRAPPSSRAPRPPRARRPAP